MQEELAFVMHKHAASHLHYDLRLEIGGVMKSWAVPKGPSMNPNDKRLAMMVEDHPLGYRTFEGTIPAGSYGAGTVMVWDYGTYRASGAIDNQNEAAMLDGLKRGHLSVMLEGTKLKGEFTMLKLKHGGKNTWLLLKKDDAHATKKDVLKDDRSAQSNRTMEEIAMSEAPVHRKPTQQK